MEWSAAQHQIADVGTLVRTRQRIYPYERSDWLVVSAQALQMAHWRAPLRANLYVL